MDSHDHRILGPRLDLFHQQEDAPGAAFWHPRGAILYRVIEDYIRQQMHGAGFREVRTPQLLARSLWERSGHWSKFRDNMFVFSEGERSFALKPMTTCRRPPTRGRGSRAAPPPNGSRPPSRQRSRCGARGRSPHPRTPRAWTPLPSCWHACACRPSRARRRRKRHSRIGQPRPGRMRTRTSTTTSGTSCCRRRRSAG